jgi:hypothetical protein
VNSLIPCYIPKELADKILFVGRAVKLLQLHKEIDQTGNKP